MMLTRQSLEDHLDLSVKEPGIEDILECQADVRLASHLEENLPPDKSRSLTAMAGCHIIKQSPE